MNPLAAQGFRCPVCGRGLELCPGRLACSRGHSFDLAREGYANLLPVQKKHTRQPGDSPLMVEARRRFLEGGHYALFAQALADLAADLARPGQPFRVMDAGCGEGYYDRALLPALVQKTGDARLIGFDISKEAVRLAARVQKEQAAFAVASCFAAPVRDGWADLAVNVFAPFAREEYLRTLRPGGWLIYAVPGPDHLFGLKEVLYDTPYRNPCQQVEYPGFVQQADLPVSGQITLRGPQIPDLFAMTPYYWKTPRQGAQRLQEREELITPIQFRFLVYQKKT